MIVNKCLVKFALTNFDRCVTLTFKYNLTIAQQLHHIVSFSKPTDLIDYNYLE